LATARELEARGAVWLEEPLSRYDYRNLARLRENTAVHIAGGEKNRGLHEFQQLIEQRVYDIIQPDASMSEGISQLRKIAALCETFKLHFFPHHGLSGFGLSGTTHLCCTVPGETWVEMMYEPPTRTVEVYQQLGGIIETPVWIDSEGFVHPPEGPGLGLEVNEALIGKYAI
jgi:L-alanine-DL-glutamate epimerase-like enolase superfamily enzyme